MLAACSCVVVALHMDNSQAGSLSLDADCIGGNHEFLTQKTVMEATASFLTGGLPIRTTRTGNSIISPTVGSSLAGDTLHTRIITSGRIKVPRLTS